MCKYTNYSAAIYYCGNVAHKKFCKNYLLNEFKPFAGYCVVSENYNFGKME